MLDTFAYLLAGMIVVAFMLVGYSLYLFNLHIKLKKQEQQYQKKNFTTDR
jgi:hypothetical protein